jgi:hypothetical protein
VAVVVVVLAVQVALVTQLSQVHTVVMVELEQHIPFGQTQLQLELAVITQVAVVVPSGPMETVKVVQVAVDVAK